jgi:hypothetical protein
MLKRARRSGEPALARWDACLHCILEPIPPRERPRRPRRWGRSQKKKLTCALLKIVLFGHVWMHTSSLAVELEKYVILCAGRWIYKRVLQANRVCTIIQEIADERSQDVSNATETYNR